MPISVPNVAVIVLNWNGKSDTLECLESVCGLEYPNLEVVVVDNGSSDGSAEAIRARFPTATLIETGANLGYAGGNNVGLEHCLRQGIARYVLLLNNDTIVHPGLVTHLVEAAEARPDAAALGAKIYFYDKRDVVWFGGGRWEPRRSSLIHDRQGERDEGVSEPTRETDYVTGCALLMRTDVLTEIGLLDASFFLTFEEADWCYRAREAGKACLYVPAATLWHKVSASLGGMGSAMGSYYFSRNRLLWGERHLAFLARLKLYCEVLAEIVFPRLVLRQRSNASLLRRIYWSFHGESDGRSSYRDPYYRARVFGVRDYLRRRFGECRPEVARRFALRTSANGP